MARFLLIDLDQCLECPTCEVECQYFYHPGNNGIVALREEAARQRICRHCEKAPCIEACPRDALKKTEEGLVRRAKLLCIGCNSCAIACFQGALPFELIPYYESKCDFCPDEPEPRCVRTCPRQAVRVVEELPDDPLVVQVGDNFAVRSRAWKAEED